MMNVGDRAVLRRGAMVRQVTVVGVQKSLSHGTRYVVAWPSHAASDPLLPMQVTCLARDSELRTEGEVVEDLQDAVDFLLTRISNVRTMDS